MASTTRAQGEDGRDDRLRSDRENRPREEHQRRAAPR
jgi:hypothetical protein